MTAKPIAGWGPPVAPRPGIVKTLGILNILFATLLGTCLLASSFWTIALMSASAKTVDVAATTGPTADNALAPFRDPALVRFLVIDLATGLPLQILMFATGIGLVNHRRWGATWWRWGGWAKIVRLVLVYMYFLIGVVPVASSALARMAMDAIASQKMPPGKGPTLSQLTMVYTYVYSIMGVAMIVLGVIYPAISIWLLGRPGVKAALGPSSAKPIPLDPELSEP